MENQADIRSAIAQNTSPLVHLGVPIVAFVVALVARLYDLTGESIWLDEAYSYSFSRPDLSFKQVVWATGSDFHPPLYYLILHVSLLFGSDLFWLRLPSVVFGALAAGTTAIAGRIVAGPTVGLLAGLLYALAPMPVAQGQEARMYALLTFEISAGLAALLWLAADRRRVFAAPASVLLLRSGALTLFCWLVVSVAFGSAMLTHNLGVYFPIMAATAVLAIWAREPIRRVRELQSFLLFSLFGMLLWMPWVPYLVKQLRLINGGYWITFPTGGGVITDIVGMLFGTENTMLSIVTTIVSATLIIFLGIRRREKSRTLALLLLFALGPIALALLISFWRPLYLARTLAWIAIPSFVAIAMAVCCLPRRAGAIAASIFLLTVTTYQLHLYYDKQTKPGWHLLVKHIRTHWNTGDTIFIHRASAALSFNFHRQLFSDVAPTLPEPIGIVTPDEASTINLPAGTKRVWLIYSFESEADKDRMILKSFADMGSIIDAKAFGGPFSMGQPSITLIRLD